jgi:hypothetical protein
MRCVSPFTDSIAALPLRARSTICRCLNARQPASRIESRGASCPGETTAVVPRFARVRENVATTFDVILRHERAHFELAFHQHGERRWSARDPR